MSLIKFFSFTELMFALENSLIFVGLLTNRAFWLSTSPYAKWELWYTRRNPRCITTPRQLVPSEGTGTFSGKGAIGLAPAIGCGKGAIGLGAIGLGSAIGCGKGAIGLGAAIGCGKGAIGLGAAIGCGKGAIGLGAIGLGPAIGCGKGALGPGPAIGCGD
jgi:hypothetical protein